MTLHAEIRAMLDKGAGQPALHRLPIQTVREIVAARNAPLKRPEVAAVEDRSIARSSGGSLPLRIYRPDTSAGKPVVVFFHGGGFATGSIETHDGLARHVCLRVGVIVVSVGYALAPEHRFPAGLDDCLTATRWVGTHAATFGGDPTRIAVAGDSSGGNFAAVTAIRIRDEGGPPLAAQLLLYPVTDHHSAGMDSYVERGAGYGLTHDDMRWFWRLYLGDAADSRNPLASPNRTRDLSGLPPAYVVTAEYDPLRDEGAAFAARLTASGVDTTRVHYADMNHGFMKWVGVIDRADEALDAACTWLDSVLRMQSAVRVVG